MVSPLLGNNNVCFKNAMNPARKKRQAEYIYTSYNSLLFVVLALHSSLVFINGLCLASSTCELIKYAIYNYVQT